MKGDRSAHHVLLYPDEHAEDVAKDTFYIHAPIPTGNDGYGIVEVGGYWVNSSDEIALESDLHNPVSLAADIDAIASISAGQQLSLDNESANLIFAGPTTGAAADPTFRALVAADLATGADATKYLRGDMTWSAFDIILDYIHEHAVDEDLSGLCDGSRTVFILANEYKPETTAIYLNGVRQLLVTDYTEDAGYDQVTMTTAPEAGDILIADYILAGAL